MLVRLEQLSQKAEAALTAAADLEALNELKVKMLGRKGDITLLLRGLKDLGAEERARVGKRANEVKAQLEELIQNRAEELQGLQLQKRLQEESIDVTLPGVALPRGSKHPLTRINEEIVQIFNGMGFAVAEGPEIELDYYNFEAL
ncbi:MAG TPA: phenylalanine--tRNA ligase subunit alpha, partial [Syntrophomonas sp.]|nr:phenylalanine--tRNA ligase subunit alpha [Syntrophomonas sp.]